MAGLFAAFHPDGTAMDLNAVGGDGFFPLPAGASSTLALRYGLVNGVVVDRFPGLTDAQVLEGLLVAATVEQVQPLVVASSRFIKDLLGFSVYGAMEVAETGLMAKFAAGTATAGDIQALGVFRAAKGWLTASQSVDLRDPVVAAVLDVCLAIPAIGMTAADKVRILGNVAVGQV